MAGHRWLHFGSMSFEQHLRRLNEQYIAASLAGDVALERATGSWRTKQGVAGMSRYLDVYVRAGDEWKAVSAQITRPAKAPA